MDLKKMAAEYAKERSGIDTPIEDVFLAGAQAVIGGYEKEIEYLRKELAEKEADWTEVMDHLERLNTENAHLKETLNFLPKIPTEPYEKAMAKEIKSLRSEIEAFEEALDGTQPDWRQGSPLSKTINRIRKKREK